MSENNTQMEYKINKNLLFWYVWNLAKPGNVSNVEFISCCSRPDNSRRNICRVLLAGYLPLPIPPVNFHMRNTDTDLLFLKKSHKSLKLAFFNSSLSFPLKITY